MYEGMITFAIALATSFTATVPARQLAIRLDMLDWPGPRKVHSAPIPLLGGLGIYCGAVLAIVLSMDGQPRGQIFSILAAATLLLIVGTLDDRGLLHHQIKLFVAMPLAALTLLATGVRVHVFSAIVVSGWASGWGPALDAGLTLFWLVGVTAAFSILDHMDGLTSGIAAIASFFFALLSMIHGQVLVGTLATAVLGASLGFLYWNFNPAKIFMGDGGAMFLGFMLATLGAKLRLSGTSRFAWMVPVLVLAVPIFDTTLVSISRLRRGLVPFTSPGKDHTAHRLAKIGLGQRGAVLALYGVGAFFGMMALLLGRVTLAKGNALVAVLGLAALIAVIGLELSPYERQAAKESTGVNRSPTENCKT